MKLGRGIGGRAMNVGYGLWALRLADWKADETTEAMVTYLMKTQSADGHWEGQVKRPPLEESFVTATVLSCAGMQKYANAAQQPEIKAALAKAKRWLQQAPVNGQEDRAAKLWGMHLLECGEEPLRAARKQVVTAQRTDGGWAQMDGMDSDAYATGQTLYVLHATGLPCSDPAYQRGVQFLLKTQAKDGSWHVKTRSRPIQEYFDNGDPYGRDQFISIPATAWALAALAQR
jgi:N-acyl-D-amino-acid deacylase